MGGGEKHKQTPQLTPLPRYGVWSICDQALMHPSISGPPPPFLLCASKVDTDGGGSVSLSEFETWWVETQRAQVSKGGH